MTKSEGLQFLLKIYDQRLGIPFIEGVYSS